MTGGCEEDDGTYNYDGTVSQILGRLGLWPKVFVKSGEQDRVILDKLGEKVLGHVWAVNQDEIRFPLKVNLFKKVGAAKMGPDMTADDLERLGQIVFTEVVFSERIIFPRSVKPKICIGRPELVGYWDNSDLAFAAVIYI